MAEGGQSFFEKMQAAKAAKAAKGGNASGKPLFGGKSPAKKAGGAVKIALIAVVLVVAIVALTVLIDYFIWSRKEKTGRFTMPSLRYYWRWGFLFHKRVDQHWRASMEGEVKGYVEPSDDQMALNPPPAKQFITVPADIDFDIFVRNDGMEITFGYKPKNAPAGFVNEMATQTYKVDFDPTKAFTTNSVIKIESGSTLTQELARLTLGAFVASISADFENETLTFVGDTEHTVDLTLVEDDET